MPRKSTLRKKMMCEITLGKCLTSLKANTSTSKPLCGNLLESSFAYVAGPPISGGKSGVTRSTLVFFISFMDLIFIPLHLPFQTFFQGHFRVVAEEFPHLAYICSGFYLIPRSSRHMDKLGFLTHYLLYKLNALACSHCFVCAEIKDFANSFIEIFQDQNTTINNIMNKGITSNMVFRALMKMHWFVFQNGLDQFVVQLFRPFSWAINREESEYDYWHTTLSILR